MNNPKRTQLYRLLVPLVLMVVAMGCTDGCAVKTGKAPPTPTQQVTLQVSRSVVALANANEVARATAAELYKIEVANPDGSKRRLIGKEDTAEIMRWTLATAGAVKKISAALESDKPWATKCVEVLAQLQGLKLPPAAERVIRNPTANLLVQTFATALTTIQSIVSSITAGVQP